MGFDKDSSKSGGGYAGGFFQLFDWTAKSRKKLFSSKSDLPERSKQSKESDGNLPMTRLNLVDEDETGVGSTIKGSSDYSCASSVTDDDGCGARAPSVVARLMGLDSLPTSTYSEPYSTPFFDTRSLQDVNYHRKNVDYQDRDFLFSGNMLKKIEGPVRNVLESKPQRTVSRPIEKFQTEILPPKSAKSIPITHHKLLSPIKSPGFIPSKNAAHIMEVAAKIIEPGPQANPKPKMPLVGSSSVPLKLRDLKEKLEAVQQMPLVGSSSVPMKVRDMKEKVEVAHKTSRPAEASRRIVESSAAKQLKGQSLNKSWNGSEDTSSFRASDTEDGSSSTKNRGKSISLAIQAKVNVQRREGLNSSSSRNLTASKEQAEARSSHPFKSLPNTQKNMSKNSSTHSSSGVLRQNNQKQNCVIAKDKLPSKSSASNTQNRKVLSGNPSSSWQKPSNKTVGSSKTGSRKSSLDVSNGEKGASSSGTKNVPRKKRLINGEFNYERSQVVDNVFADNSKKAAQSNRVFEKHFSWADDSKKAGTDIVSFTFTAPLTRSMPSPETSGQVEGTNDNFYMDNRGKRMLLDANSRKLSALGYNVIGGDALSVLLEQKLKELSCRVEAAQNGPVKTETSSVIPNLLTGSTSWHDKRDWHAPLAEKSGNPCDTKFSSTETPEYRFKHKFQSRLFRRMHFWFMWVFRSALNCQVLTNLWVLHGCCSCMILIWGCESLSYTPSLLSMLFERELMRWMSVAAIVLMPDSCWTIDKLVPVSILETCFSTESCNSSDSTDSITTGESKHCSSVQALEILGSVPAKKSYSVEVERELSDSASSTSTGSLARNHWSMTVSAKRPKSTEWELQYVKLVLCNVELMFKDFALGRAREIINPHLFDQLESRKAGPGSDGTRSRLTRKVLFDCVSECLDVRCRRYTGGGCRTWAKGMSMVRKKEWLAEEVCKEISGWRGMADCMVDELVDKDMSSQYGRWVDFEVDEFVIGVEIEGQIFDSLVDEMISDIMRV
ncbi:uncharacterized protein LOC110821284 [Carica papaya]|uniref:uncharacterized protein LOC110821284 n=1 Tax=Carica papaya TaxID=3649 RepID=UPI000B8CAF18|nr:uncharacterized protein LOC110821284 [Carica papaya]